MELTNKQKEAMHAKKGNVLVHAGAGSGKALVNGTKVQTPHGAVNIEELKIGDDVFGVDGYIYQVNGVFPQGEKAVWEVEFSNGSIVECCEEHLWTWQTASRRSKNGKWETTTIRHIHENVSLKTKSGKNFKNNVYIPLADPVRYSKKDLLIDPYLLGALIGDGGMSGVNLMSFTNSETDVVNRINSKLNQIGFKLTLRSKKNGKLNEFAITQCGKDVEIGQGKKTKLRIILEELGIYGTKSIDKFIPRVYLESSIEDRISLLNGLIDTDGYRAGSYYEYSTSSKQLGEDVVELCSSLGLTAKISLKKEPTYQYKGEKKAGKVSYRIAIKESKNFPKLHTSKKHESRWKKPQSTARLTMRKITPTETYKEMTCISVNSPDKLFLIDDYIATHNTSVFTARIGNLIANEGVDPEAILGLTFTNEAANNMKDRLGKIIGKNKADKVNLSTFHSFAYRILKQRYVGEYSNKTIMKGWWKMQQLYDLVAIPKSYNDIGLSLPCKAGDLGSFISYQKANMIKGGMDVLWKPEFDVYGSKAKMQKAFDTYCELVKNARLLDFDDMLVDLYYKLLEDDGLLFDLKDEFEYVMVDEFQDTNTVNLEILKLITDDNLFVVGDFRQGIYGFINANVENILDFNDTFENVKKIELQDNFRSTDNIVSFANAVIEKSPIEKYKNFDKQIASRSVEGESVSVMMYKDEYYEAESIINKIECGHENGSPYEDYAILLRTNAQIGFYESIFADKEIPVDVSNSKSFFDRREISDLLAYAEHTIKEHDGMSMKKIVNSPNRFISKYDVNQLDKYAYNHNISFEEACSTMNIGRSGTNIRRLVALFNELREDVDDISASVFLKNVYTKTGYRNHIEKTSATASDLKIKEDSIQRLFDIAKKFRNIEAFLAHVSVIKNNNTSNKEGVKVMTVHASKGLEFEHVFLPSVTENNFPHEMNTDTEEERRLFYVASSRAKNTMEISSPVFTPTGSEAILPSPFLIDVMGDELTVARKKVMQGVSEYSTEFSFKKAG